MTLKIPRRDFSIPDGLQYLDGYRGRNEWVCETPAEPDCLEMEGKVSTPSLLLASHPDDTASLCFAFSDLASAFDQVLGHTELSLR